MSHRSIFASLTLDAVLLGGAAHGDNTKELAREHFKQGITYFDQKRFADSLAEFERSYSIAPAFGTLYNIGQVHVALGHPVEAVDAFEKYLAQGGAAVPQDKRTRAEAEVAAQLQRIGEIKASVSPERAELRVDGNVIGKAPFSAPVRLSAGHHRVEVMLDGYRSERREVDVAGKGRTDFSIELQPVKSAAPMTTPTAEPKPAPTASPTPAASAAPLFTRDPGAEVLGWTQRMLAWGLGGVGLVGAGIGTAIARKGNSTHDGAVNQWYAGDHAGARETESDASSQKTLGFATIAAGAAMVGSGVVLLLTAPSPRGKVVASSWISPGIAGGSVHAAWRCKPW